MNKLLVIVDYQKDFVDGTLGFVGANKLDNGIMKLAQSFIENGNKIAITMDTHNENYLNTQEGKYLPIKHCILNSEGWQIFGKTGNYLKDKIGNNKNINVFNKPTFGSSNFMKWLEVQEQFDEIHFVGLVSNICVLSNALLAKTAQPEAKIIIHKDLTDSFDDELNEKTLDIMRGLQMEIV